MTDFGSRKESTVSAVFESEFGYVYNTLRRLGVREHDLKDQTQEVFLTVHQIIADYDPSRPLRPWLFGIAYRIAARYRGRAHRRREVFGEGDEDLAAGAVDPSPRADAELESARRRALVLAAIEQIDLPRRGVFVMNEIDGHPMPEIAAALGIPLNTAYSRLRLARQDFAAAVKRLREEGAKT
ncbi:MAG TPA: sigma-70 family RNA polymerase sigma factor [Labilithrix sp.]|jgi:RNA polymerase sigma-70 factor (ECF subfamily)|nr:sigma-70 family RNA polymerase sigma factor [Labilithrix sp.]